MNWINSRTMMIFERQFGTADFVSFFQKPAEIKIAIILTGAYLLAPACEAEHKQVYKWNDFFPKPVSKVYAELESDCYRTLVEPDLRWDSSRAFCLPICADFSRVRPAVSTFPTCVNFPPNRSGFSDNIWTNWYHVCRRMCVSPGIFNYGFFQIFLFNFTESGFVRF